ncbi:hypothetical protein BH20VER2_BH20VER2_16500 [soil metagenome]
MNTSFRLLVLLIFTTSSLHAREMEKEDSPAAKFIPSLLEQKDGLMQIPFADVIRYSTGKKVLPVNRDDETDARVLKQISTALEEVLARMNQEDSPVQEIGRINEVSGPFENMLQEVLNDTEGLSCDFAKTTGQKVQRSGYPDLRLVDRASKRVYYLDPKLYAIGSRKSSFRSFYFEPKVATNKVGDDAVHLILAIAHEGKRSGRWQFSGWEIVDLAEFKVRLKAEFQGSNRDMYRKEAVVASGTAAEE